jgi:hypothetical protein
MEDATGQASWTEESFQKAPAGEGEGRDDPESGGD